MKTQFRRRRSGLSNRAGPLSRVDDETLIGMELRILLNAAGKSVGAQAVFTLEETILRQEVEAVLIKAGFIGPHGSLTRKGLGLFTEIKKETRKRSTA